VTGRVWAGLVLGLLLGLFVGLFVGLLLGFLLGLGAAGVVARTGDWVW
jgi:hypothetical protein